MTTCSFNMKSSCVAIILILNALCAFSKVPHEMMYVVGCFVNGTAEAQYEFDGEEILYVDFLNNRVVYSVPTSIKPDPSQVLVDLNILTDAWNSKKSCSELTAVTQVKEEYPQEVQDPPETMLFPSGDVELGVENRLVCFVNHFYPPSIEVIWTKNDQPVSEGITLSRYYPNNDQTFRQFSTLTFTPSEGDIYSCTVQHSALETPKTRMWEVESIKSSLGPDIFCGVGLSLGVLGFATGIFLIVKGHYNE